MPTKVVVEPSRLCVRLMPVRFIDGLTSSTIPLIEILPGNTDKLSNEKPSLRIARFVTLTFTLFRGFRLIASELRLTRVWVVVTEGSKPRVIFDAVAVKNFSAEKSTLPALSENAPLFRLNVPDRAAWPVDKGEINPENFLPGKRFAEAEEIVRLPTKLAELPFSGCVKFIPEKLTVGLTTAR